MEILLPFPAKWQLPYCTLIGRLKPNISLSQAQAESQVINGRGSFFKLPTTQIFISPINRIEYVDRTTLLSLFGAVIFLVLIACANVANLQIARSVTRRRELAVRASLGAGRGRLLRQLMTESLLLSGIGGFLGVLLAYGTLDLFLAKLPVFFRPMATDVRIDIRVLAFSAALTVVAGMLFGAVPALQGSTPNLTAGLKSAEDPAFHFWGRWKIRGILIVVEVGLALVLMMGSGLLLNSFVRLQRIDLGYDPANIRIGIPIGLRNMSSEKLARLCDETVTGLRTAPGVQSAAVVESPLLSVRSKQRGCGKYIPGEQRLF